MIGQTMHKRIMMYWTIIKRKSKLYDRNTREKVAIPRSQIELGNYLKKSDYNEVVARSDVF